MQQMKGKTAIGLALICCLLLSLTGKGTVIHTQANMVTEISFNAQKFHDDPFMEVTVDVVFTDPGGRKMIIPAFWSGGDQWKVRYASPVTGTHFYRTRCSDNQDEGLNGIEGRIEIEPYTGDNPLYRHGPVRVAEDRRHFEHADGTPFLWLGDTWWKGLAKRLSWEGFKELAANRMAKGFNVIQIVCGPYPDEPAFDPRWENEGGMPYDRDLSLNPDYFNQADRRIEHLLQQGLMPVIVGAWGRSDCNSMETFGVEGLKRHWRYLVARYGAYPVAWILGGEIPAGASWGLGPWGEVGTYLRSMDPYHRLLTSHGFQDTGSRETCLIDFKLVGGSHMQPTSTQTLASFLRAYDTEPIMPALCGETGYEGHMQRHFQDVQRYVFWMYLLSGAAGHTYGAAGIHHMGVEGDPGLDPVWDYTTWQEAMDFPGSEQVGRGKKLLEEYPWWRFEPHPEWTEKGCFAAGIPGQLRFIYMPRRAVYDWSGPRLKNLEPNVPFHAFYFDPATGRRFDKGTILNTGDTPIPFEGHTEPLLVNDDLVSDNNGKWKKSSGPSGWPEGCTGDSATQKGQVERTNRVSILESIDEKDLMVSVEANSYAEAGIVLRFRDINNYLVGLYSPRHKAIYLLDRRHGQWGPFFAYRIPQLGMVDVPEIRPRIRLTVAASGNFAGLVLTDGTRTYHTPAVRVSNAESGKAGLWQSDVGKEQRYTDFKMSGTRFPAPPERDAETGKYLICPGNDVAPPVPSPQDWVLVLERSE